LNQNNEYLDSAIKKLTKQESKNKADWEDSNVNINERNIQVKIIERLEKRYKIVKKLL
jgi:hypothetical protein